MFLLSKEFIYRKSSPLKFKKGSEYLTSRRIKAVSYNEEKGLFDATVIGTRPCNVQVSFDKSGEMDSCYCSCQDYKGSEREPDNLCPHIVAVLLFVLEKDGEGFFDASAQKRSTNLLFEYFRGRGSDNKTQIMVEYTINIFSASSPKRGPCASVSLRIGLDRLYIVRNFSEFFTAYNNKKELSFGKGFSFDARTQDFFGVDKKMIDYMHELYQNDVLADYFTPDIKRKSNFNDKEIFLTEPALKRILGILKDSKFNLSIEDKKIEEVIIREEDIPVDFFLTKGTAGVDMSLDLQQELVPMTSDKEYVLYGNIIHKISSKQKNILSPFINMIKGKKNLRLTFFDKDRELLFTDILPHIEKCSSVYFDDALSDSIERLKFEPKIYLDRTADIITGEVKFIYGDREINPFSANGDTSTRDSRILIRDAEAEATILDILAETDCKVSGNGIYLDEEEKIFDFINTTVPCLQKLADVYYSDSFKAMTIRRAPSITGFLRLNAVNDFLEFNFTIEGTTKGELKDIINSISQKKKYYRLKDGSFLPLNNDALIKMNEIASQLELDDYDFEKDIIELPKYRALYLDAMLKDSGLKLFERNSALKALLRDVGAPEETEFKAPDGMGAILRDYQKLGFKWMKTLCTYGLGGILADDMGLGKTLQVIALLKYDKQHHGQETSIVIVPTSLVYNWCAEIKKFAPDLTFTAVVGSKPERQLLIKEAGNKDVIVTSYALIRRDIEDYSNRFRYCILDEAQHIKNPASIAAKAVKQIKAQHRLALTGTPMENNLTELWSVFDFILPGYLGSHGKFTDMYELPISKGDSSCIGTLSKHIRPFILRRLKQDVLKELPEKIEHVIEAELTEEQKKIYIAYLEEARGVIMSEIDKEGIGKSQIKILSTLTRLRQLCCHPALFMEDYEGESGKLSLLKEVVEDSLEGGHRILLFSQFTSMLAIIKKWLDNSGIQYLYLDGATPSEERMRLVKRFNSGEGQIFLLSLKSGGTGLNLTGADTVIHYDPWWNPAVEDQATDRAYRIGQTRNVHVMKLITHGTIEEKILNLKDRKKQLVDAVIEKGETLITKLSREDIEDLFRM